MSNYNRWRKNISQIFGEISMQSGEFKIKYFVNFRERERNIHSYLPLFQDKLFLSNKYILHFSLFILWRHELSVKSAAKFLFTRVDE